MKKAQGSTKITLATVKSFINKNKGHLLIKVKSKFDGMVDGVRDLEDLGFQRALPDDIHTSNTLGIRGAWFVKGSRDHLTAYEDSNIKGFSIYNCCGSFILGIYKNS
jgi:hypothetical protein